MADFDAMESAACTPGKTNDAACEWKALQASDRYKHSKTTRLTRREQTQTHERKSRKQNEPRPITWRSTWNSGAPLTRQSRCSFHKADTSGAPWRPRSECLESA